MRLPRTIQHPILEQSVSYTTGTSIARTICAFFLRHTLEEAVHWLVCIGKSRRIGACHHPLDRRVGGVVHHVGVRQIEPSYLHLHLGCEKDSDERNIADSSSCPNLCDDSSVRKVRRVQRQNPDAPLPDANVNPPHNGGHDA